MPRVTVHQRREAAIARRERATDRHERAVAEAETRILTTQALRATVRERRRNRT